MLSFSIIFSKNFHFTESSICKVIELGTQEITPCSFPFVVQGKSFTKCTDFLDPEGKLWCSTRTNLDTFEHEGGHGYWGYCEDDLCPITEGNYFIKKTLT